MHSLSIPLLSLCRWYFEVECDEPRYAQVGIVDTSFLGADGRMGVGDDDG